MGKTSDLDKLNQVIEDAEKRVKTLQNSIDAINKEIGALITFEITLEENIKCLKRKQIVAIAQEFKKTKEELKKTRQKMGELSNDKEHFIKASKDVHGLIKKTKDDLEKLQKSSNVLTFKSRRTDGEG